jgi:ubiquinone/menaquinone biosynthesis C-methylase UbiE
MASSRTEPRPPSPAIIFETLNAYQRTAALRAAIDLDFFTAIADGKKTAAQIASHTGVAEKGARVLSDYLTIMGFLTKNGSEYALTQDTAIFLNRHSPAYMGSTAQFLGEIEKDAGFFDDLAAAVRKGGTTGAGAGTVEPDNPIWVTFARSMAPMMAMPAELIAQMIGAPEGRAWKVLDIAAGHGLFGIAVAKHNPNARIVALDWKAVLDVAQENAAKAGVSDRYSTIPGSAFDADFGGDYDVALLTNFLHHFDAPTCEALLRKIHASLKPGGLVATLEFIPNDDRVSPPMPAMFSMMMLATTPHGDAYTFSELSTMFSNAGFSNSELRDLDPLPQRVVLSRK